MKTSDSSIYPTLTISNNPSPKVLYAIPVIGFLIKGFILIPALFFSIFLGIAFVVMQIINSFVVLFTGKYWQPAYKLTLGVMRYTAKITFFFYGVTDKYPGFSLDIKDRYQIEMAYPQLPRRLFAVPIVGWMIRMVLLIPFSIYYYIINYAAILGIYLFGWLVVLIKRQYSEALYEMSRDSVRLMSSMTAYGAGLSDKYPSFSISWNHKKLKIVLIVAAVLLLAWSNYNDLNEQNQNEQNQQVQINTP